MTLMNRIYDSLGYVFVEVAFRIWDATDTKDDTFKCRVGDAIARPIEAIGLWFYRRSAW